MGMAMLALVLAIGCLVAGAWAIESIIKKTLNDAEAKAKSFEQQLKGQANEKV